MTYSAIARDYLLREGLPPDHVVFLGAQSVILENAFTLIDLDGAVSSKAPFIFSIKGGVYESIESTAAQKAQLRCYFDVVIRQDSKEKLSTLNMQQISELLDWDAERYRQSSVNNKQMLI